MRECVCRDEAARRRRVSKGVKIALFETRRRGIHQKLR
jgi:hypothetical protein